MNKKLCRRDFLAGSAAVVGEATLGAAQKVLPAKDSFYGPTIRDRLWMWGHHASTCECAGAIAGKKKGEFVWPGKTVDMAEGCRLMGIPNTCVIRWCGMPTYPWGNYFDQFKDRKRVSFGIIDGAKGSVEEKMRIAFEELQPKMPNLTGCFLDDYFLSKKPNYVPDISKLEKISAAVHAHGLRLSVVAYSDQAGIKPEFKPHLDLCDEISFWFWKGALIPTMRDRIRRCRDFIGPDKDLLLGLYMWDFSVAEPVPGHLMCQQLEFARPFLADGTVNGLIFHPTFAAALDVPAVKLSKEWIAAHANDRWKA